MIVSVHLILGFIFSNADSLHLIQALDQVFRCEEPSIRDCVRRSVGRSVGRSVPHDAITWKTSYVAIASRRGGGRGN
jgi:hypothetical protein